MRAIVGAKKFDRISSSYKKLGILKIHVLCNFELAKLMFKFHKSYFPTSFNNFFIKASDVHHYAIRSTNDQTYYVSKFRFPGFKNIFSMLVLIKVWNKIKKTLKTLRKILKTYKNQLLENY